MRLWWVPHEWDVVAAWGSKHRQCMVCGYRRLAFTIMRYRYVDGLFTQHEDVTWYWVPDDIGIKPWHVPLHGDTFRYNPGCTVPPIHALAIVSEMKKRKKESNLYGV